MSIALGFVPLIIILLVFGTYIGVTVLPSNPQTVGTALPSASSLGCGTHFSYDSSNPISYLRIASGSTGRICVQYTDSFNNNVSFPSYIRVYGTCSACNFNLITSFQVKASPSNVSFTGNVSNETQIVVYTISVPSNVTGGIYGIFLLQFCSLFPMIVVPNNSSNASYPSSDFSSWYPHYGSCPAQFVNTKVLGVGGNFQVAQAY